VRRLNLRRSVEILERLARGPFHDVHTRAEKGLPLLPLVETIANPSWRRDIANLAALECADVPYSAQYLAGGTVTALMCTRGSSRAGRRSGWSVALRVACSRQAGSSGNYFSRQSIPYLTAILCPAGREQARNYQLRDSCDRQHQTSQLSSDRRLPLLFS
jgi:hypothetical protein